MKRTITVFLICTLLLFTTINSYADYNDNPLGIDEEQIDDLLNGSILNSIYELYEMDIVRNPFDKWENGDFINRRNAFEMLYIVNNAGFRLIESSKTYPYEVEMFSDVTYDTYDYYLGVSLNNNGICKGKFDEQGNLIADFNSYITYYEALTAISRLFGNHWRFEHKISQTFEENELNPYPYYTFCEEIGIINSNTRVYYSTLTLTEDMLEQPVSAYEFMHLLYSALYVPTEANASMGNSIYGFRYVDYFTQPINSIYDGINEDINNLYNEIP